MEAMLQKLMSAVENNPCGFRYKVKGAEATMFGHALQSILDMLPDNCNTTYQTLPLYVKAK